MEKDKKSKTELGLDENVEALLCYVLGWVTGLIFLLVEKDNKFVRFHAVQSLITFGALNLIIMVPFFGWLISPIVGLLGFILWVVLMIKAYQGKKFKLPIVGDIAAKQLK